jgi:hypothetical protein
MLFWGEDIGDNLVTHIKALLRCASSKDVNLENIVAPKHATLNVMEVRTNRARMSVHGIGVYLLSDMVARRREWDEHVRMDGIEPYNLGASMWKWAEIDGRERSGPLCHALGRSVVFGEPMPVGLEASLAAMVERNRDDPLSVIGRKAALMKAYLIEAHKMSIGEKLMEDNRNAMYRLGRMIAVCDRMQYRVKNSSNARERFIAAATTGPRMTLTDLMGVYTLNSSIAQKRGMYIKHLEDIWLDLVGEGDDAIDVMLPTLPSNEDKIQLYIGFYQQLRIFAVRRDDSIEQEKNDGIDASA